MHILPLLLALNESDQEHGLAIALCRELPADAPDWVELIPAGRDVIGVDGRRWVNDNPQRIVNAFNSQARKPFIDWDHVSERPNYDGEKPAAAWFAEMQAREGGAIWARVEWTPRGRAAVNNREHRYLSPALLVDREGRIHRIKSAGLTNTPNLVLTALNQAQNNNVERISMDPELLKALGLPADATAAAVNAAIIALNSALAAKDAELQTALNSKPSLEQYVPRADYDLALGRATTAETALNEQKQTALNAQVTADIDAALKARKIAPATVEFYRQLCSSEAGLEQFRNFVKVAPVIAPDSTLGAKRPDGDASVALNSEEAEVCRRMGISKEDFRSAV